jgi:CelD/BcsL family acetyltransferase involved in cellulose biosynthesis
VTRPATRIVLSEAGDLDALGKRWRQLEAEANASFFQSWTWVGCLADQRFPTPVLLEARCGETTVGLALLNRSGPFWERERLWLGESGMAQLDGIFIEHNGPVVARGHEDVLAACLHALLHQPILPRQRCGARRLLISGVDETQMQIARGVGRVRVRQSQAAPFLDFTRIGTDATAFLDSLSANTRYQLRRSARRYGAAGPVRVRRAGSVTEALAFLDALVRLHQITWAARGRPGAFANPVILRFHRALIERGVPRGEVDLLAITAGEQEIGYLYNFRFQNRVLAYQSGFDYAVADLHQKPGLTSHHAAIEAYRAEGMSSYDFLAGDNRYKLNLTNAVSTLHWLEIMPRWSVRALIAARRIGAP